MNRGSNVRAAGLAIALVIAAPAWSADQTIRGRQLIVADLDPADSARRIVLASAVELESQDTVIGDPTAAGSVALLEVVADGATPSAQVFPLPQGTASSGRSFWRAGGRAGFVYRDPLGEQGPVRSVLIRASTGAGGGTTFKISAAILGANGLLDVVPPNPGSAAFITLTLPGGDRYCVQFGAESVSKNRLDRAWRIRQPTEEGCPAPAALAGDFRALTYNVAGLPEGLSGSHPLTNTPQISPRLNPYELVVVQESWQTPNPNPAAPLRVYHELLVADALHPFKSPPMPLPFGTDPRRPTAIVSDGLNHFSQFPFGEVIRVAWVDCDDSAADCFSLKGFSATRMHLARGVTVDLYNLHGEAGSTPNDDVLREQGVRWLAAFMNMYSAGRAVLVGGDFNLHTDEEPDRTTFELLLSLANLSDACAALSCPDPARIDKWLFRGSDALAITPLAWSNESTLFLDPDGEPLSDHDPIAVRFAWAVGG